LLDFLERDLADEDQIRAGDHDSASGCADPGSLCGLRGGDPRRGWSETPLCAACRARPADQHDGAAVRHCSVCQREIRADVAGRRGEVVCASCQGDANAVALGLLRKAAGGDADLTALRGYELLTELARGQWSFVYIARRKDRPTRSR
jgi:hypothetical protein